VPHQVLDDLPWQIPYQAGQEAAEDAPGHETGDRRQDDVRHEPAIGRAHVAEIADCTFFAAKVGQADEDEALDVLGVAGRVGDRQDRAERVTDQGEWRPSFEHAVEGGDVSIDRVSRPRLGRAAEAKEIDERDLMLDGERSEPGSPVPRRATQAWQAHDVRIVRSQVLTVERWCRRPSRHADDRGPFGAHVPRRGLRAMRVPTPEGSFSEALGRRPVQSVPGRRAAFGAPMCDCDG